MRYTADMGTDRDESFAALFEQSRGVARARALRPGEVVDAVVVQVGRDAVFVELDGRREGFIEAADLKGADGTITAVAGDRLRVRVARVDDAGVRLVPTVEAAVAAGAAVSVGGDDARDAFKVAIGQVVQGAIDRIENYGVFVQIEGTKGRQGRGLVPVSELGTPRGADLRKLFQLGTKLKVKVIGLEEGRMRLSVRALADDQERAEFEGFREQEKKKAAEPRGFGTLGDLLKKKR